MRGLERLIATAAIWIAIGSVINNLLDRFARITADFSGFWPSDLTPYLTNSTDSSGNVIANGIDIPGLQAALAQNSQTVLNRVTDSVNAQMAQLNGNMPILVVLCLALLLAATVSTFFIWRKTQHEGSTTQEANTAQSSEKRKRGGKAALVMDMLDADELADLRARLVNPYDDEVEAFGQLLNERGGNKR